MAYKTGDFKVPFNPNTNEPMDEAHPAGKYGSWTQATGHTYWSPVWRDNWEFDDVLTYESTYKGRSSVSVTFKSQHLGARVSMPLMFFTEALVKLGMEPGGILRGRFTFAKHVHHYAIKMV
jgi:hypothetical protein